MWGLVFGFAGMATTRLAMAALAVAIWLLSRPGGWAVLAVATLVGLKFLPQN